MYSKWVPPCSEPPASFSLFPKSLIFATRLARPADSYSTSTATHTSYSTAQLLHRPPFLRNSALALCEVMARQSAPTLEQPQFSDSLVTAVEGDDLAFALYWAEHLLKSGGVVEWPCELAASRSR